MKKTLILAALFAASYAGNTSIKHRLAQAAAKTIDETPNEGVPGCDCGESFSLPPPGQGVFNGWGQSASVSQSENIVTVPDTTW